MMKILFVVPYVPNLVRVRPYNLIRALSQRGHQVTVLTVWTTEAELADAEHLRQFCHEVRAVHMPRGRSLFNCTLALAGQEPLQSVYSWQPSLVQGSNGWASYDVVHVEHLCGARYGLFFKQNSHLPVIWDSVDCITHLFQQAAEESKDMLGRLRSRLDLPRTAWYEGFLIEQFDHVLVTSDTDRDALAALSDNGHAPIAVLPNGVDLDYFSPDTAVTRDPATLIVSGKMSYHANVSMTLHLVQDIMPLIWQRRPDVRLMVVGKDPTREIQALAQHPNVTVTGTVPHLPPYLRQATLAVAPITYKAGIQNKILEAMATATPVVTTPLAIGALALQPGRDLLVADTPHEFAAKVLGLLQEPERRRQIGQAGYRYVTTQHTWPEMAQRLERIYQTAVRGGRVATSRQMVV